MTDIRTRKERLKHEIELLEKGFERRVTTVRDCVTGPLKPVEYVKRNPLKSVGIAICAGFLLGLPATRRRRMFRNSRTPSAKPGTGISSLLFDELKRLAVRHTVQMVSDLIDDRKRTKDM